jgi:hypothetical protein
LFGQRNQIPVAGINGTSQFTAEDVLLSRRSDLPLPSDIMSIAHWARRP